MLQVVPITQKDCLAFIRSVHRHHPPPRGDVIRVSISDGSKIVAVATAGRPVSRMLQDGLTLEVTRVASDGTRNACSKAYGAIRRAAKALGWKRLVTYTLTSEIGSSLKASGWSRCGIAGGGSWDRPSRKRTDKAPTTKKVRWELSL